MPSLTPRHLELLTDTVTEVYDLSDLAQLVRFKLGEDMFKAWVPEGKPLKETVYYLVTKLEQLGITLILVDAVLAARPNRADLQKNLGEIKVALAAPAALVGGAAAGVVEGIEKVTHSLNDPAIRQIVMDLRDILTSLAGQITLLHTYKLLHDSLHNLQMLSRGFAMAARNVGTDPAAAADLVQSITQLSTLRSTVAAAIADLPDVPTYRGFEDGWLGSLDEAVTLAQQASDNNDSKTGREAIQEIRRILRREPPRIDRSLSMTAEGLQLTELKNLFSKAGATPNLPDADRQSFLTREVSAEQLFRQLRALVNQHAQWQDVDGSLWEAEERLPRSGTDDPSDFDALWSGINRRVSGLIAVEPGADWAKQIADRRDRVGARRDNQDWEMLKLDFLRFRSDSIVRFFTVDTNLRQMATQVGTIGDSLLKLLNHL